MMTATWLVLSLSMVLSCCLGSTSCTACSLLSSRDWDLVPNSFLLSVINISWNTSLAECSERGKTDQWDQFPNWWRDPWKIPYLFLNF